MLKKMEKIKKKIIYCKLIVQKREKQKRFEKKKGKIGKQKKTKCEDKRKK